MSDPAKHGLFKIEMGFITQHSVRMMFEPYGPFEVAEDHYRQQRYEPEFDALPWKNEFEANLAVPPSVDPATSNVQKNADNDDAIMLEPVDAGGRGDQKLGWLEQSIARLAASRVTKGNKK